MPNLPKLDQLFQNDLARGVALGMSAALVAAAAIPVVVSVTRPLARAAIKSGLLMLEKGREAMSEAGEHFEDLVAEVKAEMVADREFSVASSTVEEAVQAGVED